MVAVAGGSGFVGSHFVSEYRGRRSFRILSRTEKASRSLGGNRLTYAECDLFRLEEIRSALRGCTSAIYLVHSMAPSSRLMQARFEDADLLLADNFARAAEKEGVEHVVYLSGIQPEESEAVSLHLASRKEVEAVLRKRIPSVTVLRAGVIFGPGGSSFTLIANLVRRLPVMIYPKWVRSWTHSTDVSDICWALEQCLEDETLAGGTYDIGGHEAQPYGDLIRRIGAYTGRKPKAFRVPFNAFVLSKWWVSLFGGMPLQLVEPLQDSLRHDLHVRDNPLQLRLRERGSRSLRDSTLASVDEDGAPKRLPSRLKADERQRKVREESLVRSIQRMPFPNGWTSQDLAAEYARWLDGLFGPLIKSNVDDEGVVRVGLAGMRSPLLVLKPQDFEDSERAVYTIESGLLVRSDRPAGYFDFRIVSEGKELITCLSGYAPALPWWLYVIAQARIHKLVMWLFGRRLARISK